MYSLKAAWEAYVEEFLEDASPEERERIEDAFFGGAAVVHYLYRNTAAASIGKQRRAMTTVHNEIAEFRQRAILNHAKKGNRENEL